MVQRQLRQVDMNRLALACVTVVKLADVASGGAAVMKIYLDGVVLSVVAAVVHERLLCMFGADAVDDDEHVGVARLENDKQFSMMANIFELYDHLLKKEVAT